ncbi:helix-turn-helix transcriptional regulator [Tellurirhabdus bombi]|uniref:helix-turn-helix transcriptional regulator n=1 Tax=Tellurirhabdus bombi TaxID=2907205 RepID=UPI001F245273|nr:hypothetical protein [Tellurirhabdus bombi]
MGSLYLIGRSVFVYLERGSLNFYMTALITLQLLLLTNWKARICISVVGLLSMSTLIYLFPPISGSSIKISYIYECIGITFMTFLGSTYFYNLEIQKFLNLHTIQIQKEKLETYTCLLEQEKQQQDHKLEQRSRELTSYTLQEMKNSRFLEEIRKSIQQEEPAEIKKIPNLISIHLQGESKWTYFKDVFENVHPDFFSRVHAQFPALNSNDIRLIALLKMKLSTKEIADILGISPQSANTARYRLRKRLQLNPDDDLEKLIYQL